MMVSLCRNGRVASHAALGAALVVLTSLSTAAVAQAPGSSSSAGHEIRIIATVPPTCQLGQIGGSARAVLAGRTDSGEAVHIEFTPSTGFNIECNTAYALSLQRIGMPVSTVPRPRASAPGPQVAGAVQRLSDVAGSESATAPEGFDVLVQIADRKIAPGAVVSLEQRCMFGVREALDEHCAIQADGLPLLPRRRNVARLTLVPRLGADSTATDAEVVDEFGLLMSAETPPATAVTNPVTTGSLAARSKASKPTVIREHLMLSVTGRF